MNASRQNFASDLPVRWCPGCGDYAVLSVLQKTLPTLGVPKENIVLVSGIGCAGRMPYYIDTYGFHTLHGRATAVATGLKVARPELSVWVVTGDGDGLSIGTNHLIHAMRRNVNINILLLNNRIYGLTKGQYSPTSLPAHVTPTSPQGSQEAPLDPVKLALSVGCSFVARGVDIDQAHLSELMTQAQSHQGTSFIEIFQNCHVFHDGTFSNVRDKKTRAEQAIYLTPNSPLYIGEEKKNVLHFEQDEPLIYASDAPDLPEDIYQHDPNTISDTMAYRLACSSGQNAPVMLGVYKSHAMKPYSIKNNASLGQNSQFEKAAELFQTNLHTGAVWQVK